MPVVYLWWGLDCQCDDDCDNAEGFEAGRVGHREKELPEDPGHQPSHGVDAQDLTPRFVRCDAVEPTLDDDEQPGEAEPGQGTGHYPGNRIYQKQVQEGCGGGDRS